jgi:predicted nucleic acid-binding protein
MAGKEKRPVPIRADAIPTDGYILTVDGKMKRRYEIEKDATTEATKLKQRFPVVQVSVYDAAAGAYTIVNTQEK